MAEANPYKDMMEKLVEKIYTTTTKDDDGLLVYDFDPRGFNGLKNVLFQLHADDPQLFDKTFQPALDKISVEKLTLSIDKTASNLVYYYGKRKEDTARITKANSNKRERELKLKKLNKDCDAIEKEFESKLKKKKVYKMCLEEKLGIVRDPNTL